jgi:multiple sugar transport system substrate-binding protein
MKNNVVKLVTIVLVGLLLLSAPGCNGGKEQVKQKRIRIWETETDAGAGRVLKEIAREFEKLHPGTKVEIEAISWGELSKKLTAALSAGDVPDVVHLQPFMVASMQSKGLLAPLDDVIEDIGKDDIYDSVEELQLFDGHYYGIAYAIGTTYFSYRKDWAQAKGLNVPRNWNEFIQFIKTLTEDLDGDGNIDRYGVILPGGSPFFMDQLTAELVASNNGRLFDKNWKPTFTEKEVIETLEFWREMAKYAPPDWTSEGYVDQFRSFATGKGASVPVTYARASKQIDKDAPKDLNSPEIFAVMQQPIGPSGKKSCATIDCEPWTIMASSKVIDEGKEFLKFFYKRENYVRFCTQVPIHLTPIRPSVAESEEYNKIDFIKKWKPWLDESLTMIREQRVKPILLVEEDDKNIPFLMELQGSRILTDMVLAVTKEGKSPLEAAKEAQRKAEEFIENMGYKKW